MPTKEKRTKVAAKAALPSSVELKSYIPYRLAVLSLSVSHSIANLYSAKFDIGIMEWRVMAILGNYSMLTANEICDQTNMDKVQVSRAVSSLTNMGLVLRKIIKSDRRKAQLHLSAKGKRMYSQIVPIAIESEKILLSTFTSEENAEFNRLLEIIEKQAKVLEQTAP